MDQVIVTVRGEASIDADPEVAVLSAEVAARAKERRRAIDVLESRRSAVTSAVADRGGAIDRINAGPLYVRPELKDGKQPSGKESVVGYVAGASFQVIVTDFAVLGGLVADLSAVGMTTLSGPWWQLRPDSEVHHHARVAAARDALVRARSYAAAFDGRIVGLLQLADQGLLEETPERYRRHRAVGLAAAGSGESSGDLDLQPVRQTVRAEVEARFAMTPPDLSGLF